MVALPEAGVGQGLPNSRRNITKSDFDLTATTAQMYIVVWLVKFPRGLRKYLVSSEL
jgi:hypothetical protein